MFIYIIILIALFLPAIVVKSRNANNDQFLSHNQTTTINGIFVLLIFLSHSTQYLNLSGCFLDRMYRHVQNLHNQWVVTTFLAFSGYGVMTNIIKKGSQYLIKFPRNRLLKTLINYDIAVILFFLVNIILCIHYSFRELAWSFIGITSIGNSNWYIFSILLMYLLTYLFSIIFKKKYLVIAISVSLCTVIYIMIAHIVGLPSRFVSTITTYALGMWIAISPQKIEKFFKNNTVISLVIICLVIAVTYKMRDNDYIMNISSCFFVALICWLMTFFEVRSKIFLFFGKHAFSIYILQRLPMIVLSHFISPAGLMNYVFVAVCLSLTIIISIAFDKLLHFIDNRMIR